MTVKKAITAAAVFVAAVAVFGLIWFSGNDSGKTESNFTTETGDYTVDEWFEKEEREGYTLTKFITMGEPSIMVEYETEGYPVSVTISKGLTSTQTVLFLTVSFFSFFSLRLPIYASVISKPKVTFVLARAFLQS